MNDLPATFGYAIAFIAPGAVALWGLTQFSPSLRNVLTTASVQQTSVGAFLIAVLAALSLGVIISGVRWLVFDKVLLRSTFDAGETEFAAFKGDAAHTAYRDIVENHYRYYQFYSNMVIAATIAYFCWITGSTSSESAKYLGLLFVAVLDVVLYFSARDAIQKFFKKAKQIAGKQ